MSSYKPFHPIYVSHRLGRNNLITISNAVYLDFLLERAKVKKSTKYPGVTCMFDIEIRRER